MREATQRIFRKVEGSSSLSSNTVLIEISTLLTNTSIPCLGVRGLRQPVMAQFSTTPDRAINQECKDTEGDSSQGRHDTNDSVFTTITRITDTTAATIRRIRNAVVTVARCRRLGYRVDIESRNNMCCQSLSDLVAYTSVERRGRDLDRRCERVDVAGRYVGQPNGPKLVDISRRPVGSGNVNAETISQNLSG